MEKYLILLTTFIFTLACTKEEPPFLNFAGTADTSVSVGSEASTRGIRFSTNIAWEAVSSESWLSVTPSSGDAGDHSVTLKIAENPDYEQRTATVTISAGSITKSCKVIQNAKEVYIVGESSFRIGSEGGNISVPIAANIEYSVSVDANSSSWLSVSQTKGLDNYTLKLSVKKNDTYDERVGYVTISAEGQTSTTLSISQSQSDGLLVPTTEYKIGDEGGKINIEVQANVEYTYSVKSGADWLSVSKLQAKALETSALVAQVSQNQGKIARTGTIEVSGAGTKILVSITQDFKDIFIIEDTYHEVGWNATTISIPVISISDYTATSTVPWLSVQKSADASMLNVSVSANDTYDERNGEISVSNGKKNIKITVRQTCKPELVVSTTSYSVGSSGGRINIPVKSNVEYSYSVISGSSWVTVSKANDKALNESSLLAVISENETTSDRTAQIKISGAGKEYTVTITQSKAVPVEGDGDDGYGKGEDFGGNFD